MLEWPGSWQPATDCVWQSIHALQRTVLVVRLRVARGTLVARYPAILQQAAWGWKHHPPLAAHVLARAGF